MLFNLNSRTRLLLSRLSKRSKKTSNIDCREVTYTIQEGSSQFRVFAMYRGRQVGRCVASGYRPTDCCYVYDVTIFYESDKCKGIGTELVRRARDHSECATVVPVDIVSDAILWWAKRACSQSFPVRLGLTTQDEQKIRYAHDANRGKPAP
jgi:hypothetical protein